MYFDKNQALRLIPPQKLLRAFANDVAGVNIPIGIQGEKMNPIKVARFFLAIGSFGNRPQLKQFPSGFEFHDLVE